MDGAAGTPSTAAPSATAAQTQPKNGTAGGVGSVASDATPGVGKTGPIGVQTLNGSTVLVNCHIPPVTSVDTGGSDSKSAASYVNNGPVSVSTKSAAIVSAAPTAIIRTSSQNNAISPQQTAKSVPTLTLVRPLTQSPSGTSQRNPATVLTSPAVSVSSTTSPQINKVDSTKTIIPAGGQVVVSAAVTGATATMRSPIVLQNFRTSVPSTTTTSPVGGIRAIAQQAMAPRLTNAPNIQNIQLPPGKLPPGSILQQIMVCFLSGNSRSLLLLNMNSHFFMF